MAGPANPGARGLAALTLALGVLTAPFLAAAVARLTFVAPIEPNEGWNALHTARLHAGGPLYLPLDGLPLSPVNYPPLSFLVLSGLHRFFEDLLVLGRWVSGASFLAIGALVFLTVRALAPGRRWPAVLGAAVWVSVGGHTAYRYLAMYEPQLLGHVFSTGALWLYARWRERLSPGRLAALALLCCLGLGTKHLLIAAPVALALVLAGQRRWRDLLLFAVSGVGIAAGLGVLAWWRFGPDWVTNILEVERARGKDVLGGLAAAWEQVGAPGSLLLLVPALALPRARWREWAVAPVYLGVSLGVASLAVLGDGVDVNAWFDLLIGASLVAGLLGAELVRAPVPARPRWAGWACLAVVLVPAGLAFPSRVRAVAGDVRALPEKERAYQREVARVRAEPGPVLYEDRLLGFLAGRPAVFDRFTGAMLLRSGRVPERVLVEPLSAGVFGLVVLERDVRARLALLRERPAEPGRVTFADDLAWTDNALRALDAAYEYVPGEGPYHVYRPRRGAQD